MASNGIQNNEPNFFAKIYFARYDRCVIHFIIIMGMYVFVGMYVCNVYVCIYMGRHSMLTSSNLFRMLTYILLVVCV